MSTEDPQSDLARRVADRLSLPLEHVERMLAGSRHLHEMCDEYVSCRKAVEQWHSIEVTGRGRLEEFQALCRDLEAELVRVFEEMREDPS
jgi:hypothetical protein